MYVYTCIELYTYVRKTYVLILFNTDYASRVTIDNTLCIVANRIIVML